MYLCIPVPNPKSQIPNPKSAKTSKSENTTRHTMETPQTPNPEMERVRDAANTEARQAARDSVNAVASRLGLQQLAPRASAAPKSRVKRTAAPVRTGMIWASVTIVREHDTTPTVQCNNCPKQFCGGSTRIESHICNDCTGESDAFLDMKQKVLAKFTVKTDKKEKRAAIEEVNLAAEGAPALKKVKLEHPSGLAGIFPRTAGQMKIESSFQAATAQSVDDAIAECFFGLNITPHVAESPLFKKMVTSIKSAPASWHPPNSKRLMGDLLDSTLARLKAEEAPTREAILTDGGTVVSDGWDDVERNHLINFLVGNAKGMFFDGTIMLSSEDSEDATHVAKLIGDEIERQGALSIVQVVTDTCSVMKSAWKIIEEKYPWITCTCCGPHVLSLELKDLGKIPEVAKVIEKTGKILNRFWGRTRWARTKLREVAAKNHGKKIGLYRAKATRFAGKVREMGRVLRLKADLQEVAISAAYAQQKWPKKKKNKDDADDEDEEEEELGGEGGVKLILLDEDGFWKPLVEALQVSETQRNLLVLMGAI